jgi:hypothetical protein
MNVRKMLYVAVALMAGGSSATWAATAVGPVCNSTAKVSSTTYMSCTGSTHSALDIGGLTCGEPVRGPIVGNVYYRFYGGCANSCSGSTCNGGAGNYYTVTGANGWDFRMFHLNADANSFSKTCDRCLLGTVGATGSSTGAHIHMDNRQYGTRSTAWYSGVVTCGSPAGCGSVIGYPTL